MLLMIPRIAQPYFANPKLWLNTIFRLVSSRATDLGMSMDVLNCQGSTLVRKCIYVAWEGNNSDQWYR